MMSDRLSVQPPRMATWLIELFASEEQFEPILGDLREEFMATASRSGTLAGRRWYWRQTLKSVVHMLWIDCCTAPYVLAITAVGGFALLGIALNLPEWLAFTLVDNYPKLYVTHISADTFWFEHGIIIGWFITAMAVGSLIATLARNREMIASIVLSVLVSAVSVLNGAYFVLHAGWDIANYWEHFLFTVPFLPHWGFTFSLPFLPYGIFGFHEPFFVTGFVEAIMIVVGGGIVRMIRLAAGRQRLTRLGA